MRLLRHLRAFNRALSSTHEKEKGRGSPLYPDLSKAFHVVLLQLRLYRREVHKDHTLSTEQMQRTEGLGLGLGRAKDCGLKLMQYLEPSTIAKELDETIGKE